MADKRITYKVIVDKSDLLKTKKAVGQFENEVQNSAKKTSKIKRKQYSEEEKAIRQKLAKELRQIRSNYQQQSKELKSKLDKDLISQKKYYKKLNSLKKSQQKETRTARAQAVPSSGGSALKSGLIVGAVAAGGAALVNFAKDLVQTTANMEAFNRRAQTVFGETFPEMQQASKELAGDLGLSRVEFLKYTSATADLLKPMGMSTQTAKDMSLQTIELSAALSEFSGGQLSTAEASNILTKAYLGERDSLQALGLKISEADLQARLAAKGQDKLTGAAKKQASALATLELITEGSTDAVKAYEENSGSLSRTMSKLNATTKDVKDVFIRAIASAFIPLAQAAAFVMEKISAFFNALPAGAQQFLILGGFITALIPIIGLLIAKIGGLGGAITAFRGMLTLLAAHPVILTLTALSLVIVGIGTAVNYAGSATDRFIKKLSKERAEINKNRKEYIKLSRLTNKTSEQKAALERVNNKVRKSAEKLGIAIRNENGQMLDTLKILDKIAEKKRKQIIAKISSEGQKLYDLRQDKKKANPFGGGSFLVDAQIKYANDNLKRLGEELEKWTKAKEADSKVKLRPLGKSYNDKDSKELNKLKFELTTVQDIEQDLLRLDYLFSEYEKKKLNSVQRAALIDEQERLRKQRNDILELTMLDELEREKIRLQQEYNATTNKLERKAIEAKIKLKEREIKAEHRIIKERQKLAQSYAETTKAISQGIFDLSKALLDEEKGSFKNFLADKLRALGAYFSKKLFLESVAAFASGNVGKGILLGAAAVTVASGANLAADELDRQAEQERNEATSQAQDITSDLSNPTETTGTINNNSTVINNYDNSVNVIETGTYLDEGQWVREKLRPTLQNLAAERGEAIIKK